MCNEFFAPFEIRALSHAHPLPWAWLPPPPPGLRANVDDPEESHMYVVLGMASCVSVLRYLCGIRRLSHTCRRWCHARQQSTLMLTVAAKEREAKTAEIRAHIDRESLRFSQEHGSRQLVIPRRCVPPPPRMLSLTSMDVGERMLARRQQAYRQAKALGLVGELPPENPPEPFSQEGDLKPDPEAIPDVRRGLYPREPKTPSMASQAGS